jgi:ergothioneine biosynthesis protein EgtB
MPASPKEMSHTADLPRFYEAVRGYTEELCAPLEPEDFVPQPVVDVSPVKWNIAHTTWFFEEMVLRRFASGYKVFNDAYRFLFNSYYNSVGERVLRHKRGDLSRPTVREVFAYRRYVDEQMRGLLARDLSAEARELVTLGLNHEQQHQELLLTDLKYTLSVNPLFPVYREDFAQVECGGEMIGFIDVAGGEYGIGFTGAGFCFDNELARHTVKLDDFAISGGLVTNAEFLEFINDGGYCDFNLWHAEGWDWVQQNGVEAPLYWRKGEDGWSNYTLAGWREIVPDAPVCHVSFYEAAAFAEWRGCRLPTEFQWEAAADRFAWGERWEWTNSAYLPYPGFTKPAGAVGEYNGKFMINQMVLRGASVATPPGHSRKTYRNFFHPHLRWQFTGIRLVK